MTKRRITVDGVLYEYTVGRVFVSIKNTDTKHVWLAEKSLIGDWVEVGSEMKNAVTPANVKKYIQEKTNEAV